MRLLSLLAATLTLAAPPAPSTAPPGPAEPPIGTWQLLTFDSESGQTHEARLWTPPRALSNGCTALLIGGGSVTDMHWTISGSYTIDGVTTTVTIDGRPTRDADTLAESLVRAGFAVMQWSAIHRDDPMYRENTALALGIPYPESVALASLALRTLREQPGVDPQRIILIGHSLGAARACQIADDGVIAMVLLAGAYLSRIDGRPSELAARAWTDLGADPGLDSALSPEEFETWRAAGSAATGDRPFSAIDADGDGLIRAWEAAAACALEKLDSGDLSVLSSRAEFRPGLRWPLEVLASRPIPTLAIYAGLDPISVHGPHLASADLDHVEVAYAPGLNHQFASDRDGRTGPIDAAVVERLIAWLKLRCPRP